jgi:alanyl-tRNA synthetase
LTGRCRGDQVSINDGLGKLADGVVILGAAFGADNVIVVVFCSPAANKSGTKAGDIVRGLCTKLGGKGGGKDVAGLDEALRGMPR